MSFSLWSRRNHFRVCHGCGGKGWVETINGVHRCPICNGSGRVSGGYDPDSYPDWIVRY